MQLILTTDVETGIQSNMSTIEQKSLDQKFDHAALIENLIKDYEGHKDGDENTEKTLDSCNETLKDNSNGDATGDKEVLSDGEDIIADERVQVNSEENENKVSEQSEQLKDLDNIESDEPGLNNIESGDEVQAEEENNDRIGNCDLETDGAQPDSCEKSNDAILEVQNREQNGKAVVEDNEKQVTTIEELNENQDVAMDVDSTCLDRDCKNEDSEVFNTNVTSYDETSHVSTANDEIINISDEKEEDARNSVEKQNHDQKPINTHTEMKSSESDVLCEPKNESDIKIIDNATPSEQKTGIITTKDGGNLSVSPERKISTENSSEDKKKLSHICKLSNTLDILSDEEDEIPQRDEENESQKERIGDSDKVCINIDDDDDIMLVDDNTPLVNRELVDASKAGDVSETCKDETKLNMTQETKTSTMKEETLVKAENTIENERKESEENSELKSAVDCKKTKPLLPTNFLKTCKKNLADMTRDELEQFCIMKIVEGVVDRSNLAEIKNQLKTMAQNLDEYKKRTQMISKQNRDLQVVLKSVQEEQKKGPDHVINPLKITRSVGMQVLMTDKCAARRKSVAGPNNNTNNKQIKSRLINSKKTQMIPVPRLVPAVTTTNVSNKSPTNKQASGSFLNGVSVKSSPPAPKTEKRTHSKMQQNNPDTVDLTDDEPPSKQPQRNINPPVRLVPPQNLMATPRQTFSSNINSPRKVYIPISGSQTQSVRPGQTFMLKAISPAQGPRPRMASSLMCKQPSNVRVGRQLTRHPAPLPESTKQFEPPNWKSLPPAPELKLSKVENGIVISWKIDGFIEENYEEIASFQLYAYQETTSPPNTALWKKIGDVKALPLPMACTLTQFMAGYKYYFAVRAVDVKSRVGPFSEPGSILLLNKM
ncbi:activating transcription factor 7-interacting protein 2 [Danaus plexippus]|uniref:activating transcription factor 7-interacting protein 2 n=1 Tax=Danaus plexippus TaxID=13037 RepID=UPI002AB0A819|nr:activating transcription factor 7-interacting protein 2 [Danaus plexippus]XP_032520301.2 activating transcription factor 7-interacting protein 2 [Danaus plexippus]